MDTDVLIVGAGPTGLMLANQLARRGVRAQIIDRHAGPAKETRALGVQARTLEIYAHLGIVGRALKLGKPGVGGNIWAQGRWLANVRLSDAGDGVTPYPYILVLGQDDNEIIMGERLRELSAPNLSFSLDVTGFAIPKIELLIEGAPPQPDPADRMPQTLAGPAVCHPGELHPFRQQAQSTP